MRWIPNAHPCVWNSLEFTFSNNPCSSDFYLERLIKPGLAATFVVAFQARREEEATSGVDDERRRLKRNRKRPGGLRRQQPICGVSAPRRHLSPRYFSLHLDHCRHNAATQILLGVLRCEADRRTAVPVVFGLNTNRCLKQPALATKLSETSLRNATQQDGTGKPRT